MSTNVLPTSFLPPEELFPFVNAAIKLQRIFVIDSDTVATSLKGVQTDRRPVSAQTLPMLYRIPHQINQTLVAVPDNYLSLQCWNCCNRSHRTFNCPHLTVSHGISFANRYYLHQMQQNPMMMEW